MNQRPFLLKTFLAGLTLSAAFLTLPVHVHASELSTFCESAEDMNQTLCTRFHLRSNAQPVFDDPSNQGENVIQLYETIITGFNLLEDYKRTGDFRPFKGSAFETFFTPLLKNTTFHKYIDFTLQNNTTSCACTHAQGLVFLQSFRPILACITEDKPINDSDLANYFLFRSYLEEAGPHELLSSMLLPEDEPYYLRASVGIQWFDNQVIRSLMRHGSESISIIGDGKKGEIQIPFSLWGSFLIQKHIHYTGILKGSEPFYFYYSQHHQIPNAGELPSPFAYGVANLIPTPQSSRYQGFHYTTLASGYDGVSDSVSSGIVLNKDGGICVQSNLFFEHRKGKMNKINYFYDTVLEQYLFHKFKDITATTHEERISPYEKLLIKLAGGVDAIKQRNLISFDEIIQEHSGETPEELAFFLSCLNYLKDEPDSSPAYSELASKFENRLLTYYDTTLSAAEVAHITAALQTQVNNEIDLLVDEALEHHNPEIIQEINDYYAAKGITKVIAIPKPTSKGGTSGKKGKKAEAKNSISIAKKDLSDFKQKKAKKIVEANTESEIQKKEQEKRANALARLRSEALRNLNGLKHLSRSELGSILDGIREKVAELDVTETGKIAIRGSHQGREVASAGGSTKLSVARRSEKDGYSVGTVKTIVKDHFDKLSKIL